MPTQRYLKTFLLLLTLSFVLVGYSQTPKKSKFNSTWQINYNLGFTQFYGDASNNGYFKKFSGEIAFATGATVRRYFSPVFGLGLNLWYTGVKSHKDKNAVGGAVDYTLTGSYFDGNVNLLIDFNNLFWGTSPRKFSVYGILGIGYGSWNTSLYDAVGGGTLVSGSTIGNTTFKSGGFVVPAGIGMNYMLNDNWALNFEMNLRTVLNDDVDVWRDGFKYDQLLYTSFGVSYFIGGEKKSKSKKPKRTEPVKADVKLWDYRMNQGSSGSGSKPEVVPVTEPVSVAPSGVIYRVQILAKRNNIPTVASLKNRFNIQGVIYENYQDGIHRFSTGEFTTYQDALQHSYLIRDKGVHDAFVVAYENNRRIRITPEMKNR